MTSVLRVKHLEQERLVMEFEENCRDGLTMDADTGLNFLDNDQHFLDSHLWICALG
jgi:hypothetical protein